MSAQLPSNPPAPHSGSAINRIVAFGLEQRFLIILLAAGLIGAGWWALKRLPMDAYPDLSPPIVEIITQWPGHSAEEIERLVTVPVELGHERHSGPGNEAFHFVVRIIGCHPHLPRSR